MHVNFFVEDKAQIKFLIDFISERFSKKIDNGVFYKLGGWSGYKIGGIALPDYSINSDRGETNLTFLDADVNYSERKELVEDDFKRLNINSHLFLFPDNSNNGEIETLLATIAVDRKIIECFESYEKCIKGYQVPVNKSKIFAYLDALLVEKNKKNDKKDLIQEGNRDYKNSQHWNLNHIDLEPLYKFLFPMFNSSPT